MEFLSSVVSKNNLGSRHEIFSKFRLVSGWSDIEILIERVLDLWNPCLKKPILIKLGFFYNELACYGPWDHGKKI